MSPSAQKLRALGSAQVTFVTLVTLQQSLSFDDYYFSVGGSATHLPCSCCCGGHTAIGPPSGAGTCGTAAAKYVPTNPHIRIEILIACFIGFSPIASRPKKNKLFATRGNYTARVKPPCTNPRILPKPQLLAGNYEGRWNAFTKPASPSQSIARNHYLNPTYRPCRRRYWALPRGKREFTKSGITPGRERQSGGVCREDPSPLF